MTDTLIISNKKIIDQLEAQLKQLIGSSENNVPTAKQNKYIAYGTSGFRGRADDIEHLFFNVGLICGLKSLREGGSNIGIMITASHNPVQDNGVKLIISNGQMLESKWEPLVEHFCNLPVDNELAKGLDKILTDHLGEMKPEISISTRGHAIIGYDTRPSSVKLVELVKKGLGVWKEPPVTFIDYGQVTTPALHWLVGESTRHVKPLELNNYYDKLISGLVDCFGQPKVNHKYNPTGLIVDCANGVGSHTMNYLCNDESFRQHLPIQLINFIGHQQGNSDGILNHKCGADFVKTNHMAPTNAHLVGKRYASLDGDADRVVYFYPKPEDHQQHDTASPGKLCLLDGDKILALYAHFIDQTLTQHNLKGTLSMGIVQTAYANGASTDYLQTCLGHLQQVDCTDTGVKYLHKKALDYDIGVYFEANGHGTIWMSDKARDVIESSQACELKHLLNVLNNYTGDAVSDILMVELILRHYDWSIEQWDQLYMDRPNCLTKVEIRDRTCVETTNAGRTCVKPAGLQDEIDSLVKKFPGRSRCFVRASGTENVVRIYAECPTQEAANELAKLAGKKVVEICDGCV